MGTRKKAYAEAEQALNDIIDKHYKASFLEGILKIPVGKKIMLFFSEHDEIYFVNNSDGNITYYRRDCSSYRYQSTNGVYPRNWSWKSYPNAETFYEALKRELILVNEDGIQLLDPKNALDINYLLDDN